VLGNHGTDGTHYHPLLVQRVALLLSAIIYMYLYVYAHLCMYIYDPFTLHQVTKEQCWATTDGTHYHPLLVKRVALLLAAIIYMYMYIHTYVYIYI